MLQPIIPEIDAFLHEPARLRVLAFLAMVDAADFMHLLRQTGLSRGNLSVQMTKLEDAELVDASKREVDGRLRTAYALSPKGVNALRGYKATMEEILAALPG
ncbi:MAG: transcriptional regulator [Gemmatimonadetes bacterium]|jgi:DNA-binding transcriptional ArsR family regulator|nr:transcriptional regulator [Gemmatimonadota bacterium]